MSKNNMISDWKELAGKIIEAAHCDGDEKLFLELSNNKRAIIRARGGYHAGEANLELQSLSDVYNWELKCAGWITEQEYKQREYEKDKVFKAAQKERDRKEFERLKGKFGGNQ